VVNSALVVRGANFTTLSAEARRMSFDGAHQPNTILAISTNQHFRSQGRYVQYSTTVGHLVNQSYPDPAGKIVFFPWSPPQHDWISPFVQNLTRRGAIGVVIAHTVRDDDLGGIQFLLCVKPHFPYIAVPEKDFRVSGPYPGWSEVNIPIIAIKAQDWGPIQDSWDKTILIGEFNCTGVFSDSFQDMERSF
jgi:hypothetical protein